MPYKKDAAGMYAWGDGRVSTDASKTSGKHSLILTAVIDIVRVHEHGDSLRHERHS